MRVAIHVVSRIEEASPGVAWSVERAYKWCGRWARRVERTDFLISGQAR